MQSKKARTLRIKWGNKPCEHPGFDSEYFCGTYTGNYVCIQCGQLFTLEEKNKLQSKSIFVKLRKAMKRKQDPFLKLLRERGHSAK